MPLFLRTNIDDMEKLPMSKLKCQFKEIVICYSVLFFCNLKIVIKAFSPNKPEKIIII
jgi:hypothetical protein